MGVNLWESKAGVRLALICAFSQMLVFEEKQKSISNGPLGSACAGEVVSLTVGMAVSPTDGKMLVFEEN